MQLATREVGGAGGDAVVDEGVQRRSHFVLYCLFEGKRDPRSVVILKFKNEVWHGMAE